jgi:SAM-dependent methyltransferase
MKDSDIFESPATRCPLCSSASITRRYTIQQYTPSFNVDRCDACGFMFMNPRFTDRSIMEMYGEGYFSGKSEYAYHDEREIETYAMHVWNSRIERLHGQVAGGNFLDIGCSFGGLMKAASRYYVPHGIELSPFAGSHAKALFGDRVHVGTLADHPFPERHFSVITMVELLEHLPDPSRALRECYRLLDADGLLMIQTANMDGLQARMYGPDYAYFMPGHLSYFSRNNLAMALRGCGFGPSRVFHPVEFGLLPKLKKSRGTFKSPLDYRAWIRISAYHLASKIHCSDFAVTSSMVMYARKCLPRT